MQRVINIIGIPSILFFQPSNKHLSFIFFSSEEFTSQIEVNFNRAYCCKKHPCPLNNKSETIKKLDKITQLFIIQRENTVLKLGLAC